MQVQASKATKKQPNPVDRHVGAKVRMRRIQMGMSQEKLGDQLGLTFQQVQKYEKGANRIGASRLTRIAEVLRVNPGFFFEGAPALTMPNGHEIPADISDEQNIGMRFLASKEGVSIATNFFKINDPKIRRSLIDLIERVAAQSET